MRAATRIALLLASLLLASQAFGQGPHGDATPSPHDVQPGADVPDVPPGPGAIVGRVVHEARPGAVSGLPVVLYALPRSGVPGLRGATTDATGGFRFEGIATDPDTAYLVGVRFAGIPFGLRTVFGPGETQRSVEVKVSDPTADASGVTVGVAQMRFERGCDDLRVIETMELRNPTDRVFFVPEDQRGDRPPIAETLLPEGASEVQVPFGSFPQGIDQQGRRLRFWGPLYPGSQEVEFGYGLSAASAPGVVERGFPTGAERVVVLTPDAGASPTAEGLRDAEPTEVDGRSYHTAVAERVGPGKSFAIRIGALGPSEAVSGVGLADARIWLELDDAALVVDERYTLDNSNAAPAGGAGDAPLLCIPVPPHAQELRFSPSAISLGLTRDPSGALAVSGPAPPGESSVAIRYLLPVESEPVSFERRFDRAVPLLSVVVADTGVVASSDRLHRLRPIQSEDLSYIHLEGFEIEPGETVNVTLEPLAAPVGLASSAAVILLGLMSVGTVAFLAGPLGAGPRDAEKAGVSMEHVERESVLQAMRDLDDDFETGKIAEDDYQRDRHRLQARAVALLQAERQEGARPTAAPSPPSCPSCRSAIDPGWRFCASCGAAVSAPGEVSAATGSGAT